MRVSLEGGETKYQWEKAGAYYLAKLINITKMFYQKSSKNKNK